MAPSEHLDSPTSTRTARSSGTSRRPPNNPFEPPIEIGEPGCRLALPGEAQARGCDVAATIWSRTDWSGMGGGSTDGN
jgi:hypothetical protein